MLVDFIVECTHSPEPEKESPSKWKLFVDGASNVQGSGVVIVLISPEDAVLEYSLQFTFPSSNNVVEYETFITNLSIPKKL